MRSLRNRCDSNAAWNELKGLPEKKKNQGLVPKKGEFGFEFSAKLRELLSLVGYSRIRKPDSRKVQITRRQRAGPLRKPPNEWTG